MKSLSLFVGSSRCNAHCKHCAGRPLRQFAPRRDGVMNDDLIRKTVVESYDKGAKYLSISSSGEPTLSPNSVSRVLDIINEEGLAFNPINLYSNGILLAQSYFSKKWLAEWKNKGLTTVYITVHSIDREKNAKIYGIKHYPSLRRIVNNVLEENLKVRANMILSKNIVSSFDEFKETAIKLLQFGVNKISAWPIRKLDDTLDLENAIDSEELSKIIEWSKSQPIRIMSESNREDYVAGDKLTLFPNGVLSNTWCS